MEPSDTRARASGAERAPLRDLAWFAAIVLVAFLVRLLYLHQARAVPMFDALVEDGESYGAWSDRLAAGDWLGSEVFYQAPLYPYFLGVVKVLFGRDLATIRVVQIALGALSCGFLFLAGKSFFSRGAGVASGLLLALYPSAIFFDACIQKAGLGLLWMTLLLLALAKLRERASVPRWLALGAVTGLLMLTREETLLLVPVLALWGAWSLRAEPLARRLAWLAAFVAGLALPLAPTAWRNRAVGGELVLTTSQAGSNFYIGNHAGASGTYEPLRPGRSNVAYERQDAIDLAELAAGRKLTPKQVSAHWFARSREYIAGDPLGWIGLLARKCVLLVNAYEMPDAEDLYFYERYVPLLRVLDWILPWGVLVPLGIAGLWLERARRRELAVLWLLLATLAVGVVAFYVFARYRYPLVPVLALFAGALLARAWSERRTLGRLASTWVVLAVAAVAVNWPLHARDYQLPQSYSNAAMTREAKGDHAGAIALFEQALALQPGNAQIRGNLGVSLERAGRLPEAIAAYRQACASPRSTTYDALRLANALARAGERAESVGLLAQVEAHAANDAIAWRDLGIVYAEARRYEDAVRCQRRASELGPRLVEPRLRLAWLRAAAPDARLRDGAQALELARTVVPSAAQTAFAYDVLAAACAESGRFADARAALARAETLAATAEELKGIRERKQLYAREQPWRLPAD